MHYTSKGTGLTRQGDRICPAGVKFPSPGRLSVFHGFVDRHGETAFTGLQGRDTVRRSGEERCGGMERERSRGMRPL